MTTETTTDRYPAKTIDEVLDQLDEIIDQTIEQNSYLCAFAYVYRRTTFEVKKAIEGDRFENVERMEKMDVIFANLYIKAFRDYQDSKEISSSWKYAFEAKNDHIALIQHILLGMNAHINLDLSVAAATVSSGSEIIKLKNDFMVVNQILADLTNTIQKGLGKASFMMKLLDIFGFRSDEKIINFSIKKARDFAWINALELALLEKEDQTARVLAIDKSVVEISKLVRHPPGKFLAALMKLISIFESKDVAKMVRKLKKE